LSILTLLVGTAAGPVAADWNEDNDWEEDDEEDHWGDHRTSIGDECGGDEVPGPTEACSDYEADLTEEYPTTMKGPDRNLVCEQARMVTDDEFTMPAKRNISKMMGSSVMASTMPVESLNQAVASTRTMMDTSSTTKTIGTSGIV
jgi:hypothetical protein